MADQAGGERTESRQSRGVVPERIRLFAFANRSQSRATEVLALLLLGALAIALSLAPLIAPYDPRRIDLGAAGQPPGLEHLLGTDRLGRDVLSRWLVGGRTAVLIAAAAAGLGAGAGALLGVVSGYREGRVGAVLDRLVDVGLSLPLFFVAIALQAALPPGEVGVILVLGATGWMGTARILRGEVLRVKRSDFVEAARALGCSDARVVLRHVLPHCSGALAAAATAGFGEALLLQSTLSFLGLGVPPPAPSWGGMLLESTTEMVRGSWWLVVLPGASILAVTAAVGVCAERLRTSGASILMSASSRSAAGLASGRASAHSRLRA